MRIRTASTVLALLVAAGVASVSAAGPLPYLRSAGVQRGHVVVAFGLGELAPSRLAVASRALTQADGSFVAANIRIDEPLIPRRAATGYRARTKHMLPPGRYWVKISGRAVDLDCMPHKPCRSNWSNARRILVPRP